jgi:hypothetical protein
VYLEKKAAIFLAAFLALQVLQKLDLYLDFTMQYALMNAHEASLR